MSLTDTQRTWDRLGKDDPLWAIISRSEKRGGKWGIAEFFATGEREIADVMRYVESLPVKISRRKALDFGCGVGRLTQPLARYFDAVVGVDIAASMIGLANKYNAHRDRCAYILNTRDDLRIFPDNNFDFVYTNITLQHMAPRFAKKYIREFLRILAPDGVLLFQLPSAIKVSSIHTFLFRVIPWFLIRAWYRMWAGTQPRIEMFGVRQRKMIAFLKKNGATILDVTPDQSAGEGWTSYRYCVTK